MWTDTLTLSVAVDMSSSIPKQPLSCICEFARGAHIPSMFRSCRRPALSGDLWFLVAKLVEASGLLAENEIYALSKLISAL